MTFELGGIYTLTKPDGTMITFKFIGGSPPMVECNGQQHELMAVTSGTFINIRKA